MSEVLAVAAFTTDPRDAAEALTTLRALSAALAEKGYSRDLLYHDGHRTDRYVLLRYWRSEDAKREAQEDPAVQRFWARLGLLINIERVYETLEALG